jgi:hypothetical protein
MLIKFKCSNIKCDVEFTKDELELIQQKQPFIYCWKCGSYLHVKNLEEIAKYDIEMKVKQNLNKWFAELGADNTLDLLERNKTTPCYRLYKEELEKRGFKFK